MKTCNRCKGSGQHGPAYVNFGVCFKCAGAGVVAPPAKKVWVVLVSVDGTKVARQEVAADLDRRIAELTESYTRSARFAPGRALASFHVTDRKTALSI
jgi:hypothetical protein